MDSPRVEGHRKSVRDLLSGNTYHLEYFQREYVWEQQHVETLINDLYDRFYPQWDRLHEREEVEGYREYFLGPIVSYRANDGKTYLADGQQRFVTLLLLMIHLRLLLDEQGETREITALDLVITNYRYGRLNFAIEAPHYSRCFDNLFHGRDHPIENEPASVKRIVNAYRVVQEAFPPALHEALPYFVDWLLNRVSLVLMEAGGPQDAWAVFRAMNDRGVHLTSMELLKGFLLDKSPEAERGNLNNRWQRMVSTLDEAVTLTGGRRELSTEYVRSLLRAKYLPLGPDGLPDQQDLETINGAAHEWIRLNVQKIVANDRPGEYRDFVADIVVPVGVFYAQLVKASVNFDTELAAIYYNRRNGLERQFDLVLATLRPGEHPDRVWRLKAALVANFLDLLVVRGGVGNNAFRQQDLDAVSAELLAGLRNAGSLDEARAVLSPALSKSDNFKGVKTLRLRDNHAFVRYFLSRLTAWLEVGVGNLDPRDEYLREDARGPIFQIEHLLAATKHGFYSSEVRRKNDFDVLRSRIGALVLLHERDNKSLRDASLAQKVGAYKGKNLLAESLHSDAYASGQANSRFLGFIRQQSLDSLFGPYGESILSLVDRRGQLYRAMAARVWDPAGFGLTEASTSGSLVKRRRFGVAIGDLVNSGLVPVGTKLTASRNGTDYIAVVESDGTIRTPNGAVFPTPSEAAMDVLNSRSQNGWIFWKAEVAGEWILLDVFRKRYLGGGA
jgi:hypothetical protein